MIFVAPEHWTVPNAVEYMCRLYRLRDIPEKEFIPLTKAARILKRRIHLFIPELIASSEMHALSHFDIEILLHPDTMAKHMQKETLKRLNNASRSVKEQKRLLQETLNSLESI
jgi:hypothetical protein